MHIIKSNRQTDQMARQPMSVESKTLSNGRALEHQSGVQNTTISAVKEPGKRAGIIFTRLSHDRPNVAIISMIMDDSIFAKHNKAYDGKLEGSIVTAVNGVEIDDARHAARMVIMEEGKITLTIKIAPLKAGLEVKEVMKGIATNAIGAIKASMCDINVNEQPSAVSSNIVEMAPSSLKLQLRDRMQTRQSWFDLHGQIDSSFMISSSRSTSDASDTQTSVNSRRMTLFADRLDKTCSDMKDISRFLDGKRSRSFHNNINQKTTMDYGNSNEHYAPKSTWSKNMKNNDNGDRLYTTSSSVTSATADLTCVSSISIDDGSTVNRVKRMETDLQIDPSASIDEEATSICDLSTPQLLERVENLSRNMNKHQQVLTPASDIFDRIMYKYSNMSAETTTQDIQFAMKAISPNDVRNDTSLEPLNLHRRVQMMHIELKESIDEDESDVIRLNDFEEDDVSMLSRSTCLTIGSASFYSTDTREIQSHVKSLVNSIVQKELVKSGSMKKELEDALESKAKLESRLRRLERRNVNQELKLREAHLKNETIIEEIDEEMTFYLTQKAAELQSCINVALEQAEESKRRAVQLAKSSMEEEILTLRSELDEALANGVHFDFSVQKALALVESTQQTLRLAAEHDAREAVKMKVEIQNSFVNTVEEFEAWAEKQVYLMERLERSISKSGSIEAKDEVKLLKMKHSLETAMQGLLRVEHQMKTKTQSKNPSVNV